MSTTGGGGEGSYTGLRETHSLADQHGCTMDIVYFSWNAGQVLCSSGCLMLIQTCGHLRCCLSWGLSTATPPERICPPADPEPATEAAWSQRSPSSWRFQSQSLNHHQLNTLSPPRPLRIFSYRDYIFRHALDFPNKGELFDLFPDQCAVVCRVLNFSETQRLSWNPGVSRYSFHFILNVKMSKLQ